VSFDIESDDATIRIVLADADPLARRMTRDALQRDGITVVAEASNGGEAVELAAFYHPDAVVMDVGVPVMDAVQATYTIYTRAPGTCIVLLAAQRDDALGLRALRAGAAGYLAKDLDPEVLPRVLRGAIEGEAAISRRLAMRLIQSYRRAPLGGNGLRPVRSDLTDREWEVLDLLSSGEGTEDIARTLVLSTETVRSHLKNLYRKLGVRSRKEAIDAARRLREPVI
jgi:two-component system, NarL family, response regulator LiaR